MTDVDALKDAVPISMVLDYIGARKGHGSLYYCPFCADEFSHNPGAGLYYGKDGTDRYKCFVCGFGGDVIDVARRYLGDVATFSEAVEWLTQTFTD